MEGCLQQLKAKEYTPLGFAALGFVCVLGVGGWSPEVQGEEREGQHSNQLMEREQSLMKYLRSAFYLPTADSTSYLA